MSHYNSVYVPLQCSLCPVVIQCMYHYNVVYVPLKLLCMSHIETVYIQLWYSLCPITQQCLSHYNTSKPTIKDMSQFNSSSHILLCISPHKTMQVPAKWNIIEYLINYQTVLLVENVYYILRFRYITWKVSNFPLMIITLLTRGANLHWNP